MQQRTLKQLKRMASQNRAGGDQVAVAIKAVKSASAVGADMEVVRVRVRSYRSFNRADFVTLLDSSVWIQIVGPCRMFPFVFWHLACSKANEAEQNEQRKVTGTDGRVSRDLAGKDQGSNQ